ncbi:MAG: transketolase [bacterium]|nr:transketolase [bacterium]
MDINNLKKKAVFLRERILDMGYKGGSGHIAPSLSCVEILVSIYYSGQVSLWKKKDPDKFVLSKGHGALGLYAIFADKGILKEKDINDYCKCGNCLVGLAEHSIPGIEVSTGSLGHGLSIAAGMAFAARADRRRFRTFVMVGDGECQEGSIWEAVLFASHNKLNNLIVIVDRNFQQAIGFTEDILGLEPLDRKFASFGWDVKTVDGHSLKALVNVLKQARARKSDKPLCIIANTIKGKGISYMEKVPIWHYRCPNEQEYEIAKKDIKKCD